MESATQNSNAYGQTNFLRVSAARPDQHFRPIRINEMSEVEVQRLANGHQVFAFVGVVGSRTSELITSTQVPLKALAVISPVFNMALVAHNRNSDQTINNVILPAGDHRAYREVIAWVNSVVQAGRFVPMRDLRDRPISCYAEIVWIANRLRIPYLASGLRRRVFDVLKVRPGKQFTMHPGDVKDAYANLPEMHWAKRAIVAVIADAEKQGVVHEKFRGPLNKLYDDVIGFEKDVQQKLIQMQDGGKAA